MMAALLFFACAASPVTCDVGGCSSDPCEQLCVDLTSAIRRCRVAWGTSWEVLGASGATEYRNLCVRQWQNARTGLEPREIDLAEAQCDDARLDLADLVAADQEGDLSDLDCDVLRALYL
ncbi:MAG TPA: hypothetical protein PLA94_11365 [Myxococcota bacterium]|nr:hypothetical protein [Myxococcota bacterium]